MSNKNLETNSNFWTEESHTEDREQDNICVKANMPDCMFMMYFERLLYFNKAVNLRKGRGRKKTTPNQHVVIMLDAEKNEDSKERVSDILKKKKKSHLCFLAACFLLLTLDILEDSLCELLT